MAGARKSSRGGRGKGLPNLRSLVLLGLLGFFVMAMGVIARRTFGIGQSREIRDLERRRDAVDAARVQLEVDIRDASSRARLGPIAEQRLQMHVPADSQVIILPREPRSPKQ